MQLRVRPFKRKDAGSGLAAIDRDVLDELAAETEGYTGDDIEAVCHEAATIAVREHVRAEAEGEASDVDAIELTVDHFERALEEISPDVGEFAAGAGPDVGEFGDAFEGAEGEA